VTLITLDDFAVCAIHHGMIQPSSFPIGSDLEPRPLEFLCALRLRPNRSVKGESKIEAAARRDTALATSSQAAILGGSGAAQSLYGRLIAGVTVTVCSSEAGLLI
jgi:hypothetical protein